MENVRFVGLDVHADSIAIAVAEAGRGEPAKLAIIASDKAKLLKVLRRLGRVKCCYEAGPTGFALQRELSAAGIDCVVVAPSLVPAKAGDRVKTDRRDGKTAGGPPPFGYTSQTRAIRELSAEGHSEDKAYRLACERYPLAKTWYLDDTEAEVVRLAFHLYLDERWGARRISEELNRRGYRRRGGFLWSPVKVGKIINNPAVAGFTSFDEDAYARGLPSHLPRFKQVLFPGIHAAIISPEYWQEAQRIKAGVNATRLRTKGLAGARIYPLSGVLRCGTCGARMMGKSSGIQKPAYYMCARRKYYGVRDGCAGITIHQPWAERTVWDYLDKLFTSPDLVEQLVARATTKLETEKPQLRDRLARLHGEIADVEARQRRWMEKYEEAPDQASAEIIWKRVHELKSRELVLTNEAQAIQDKLTIPNARQLTGVELARHLARLREHSGTLPAKRRALVELLERHHDLRIRVLDERRLVMSLRLDPLLGETSPPPRGSVGRRIVMTSKSAITDTRTPGGPVSPGSPQARGHRPHCPSGLGRPATL